MRIKLKKTLVSTMKHSSSSLGGTKFMLKKEYGTFSVADLKKAKPIPESEWNTFSVPPLTKEKARSLQRECNKKN